MNSVVPRLHMRGYLNSHNEQFTFINKNFHITPRSLSEVEDLSIEQYYIN